MLLRTGPSPRRSGFGHAGGTVRGPAVAVFKMRPTLVVSQIGASRPSPSRLTFSALCARMMTPDLNRRPDSVGWTRRELLRAGALGLFGLSVPGLLQGRAAAPTQGKTPSFGRAKSCILLFMWGGPAHQDTWDLKPDAPLEIRGEFRPIATNVPGIQICEHFPL